eukprot:749462-Hanusia_phi.AAC.1
MFGSSAPSGPEMPDLPTSASSPPSMLDRMQQSTQGLPPQQKAQEDNWEMAYDPASGAPWVCLAHVLVVLTDELGRYWYKVSTGESTWENPNASTSPSARPAAKPAGRQSAKPAAKQAATAQLPNGQRYELCVRSDDG